MPTAKIHITPKAGVLDPQGSEVEKSLDRLGFDVSGVRVGKYVELALPQGAGKAEAQAMCEKLLANPVVETFEIEIV